MKGDRQTDIATTRKNRPKGRFFENNTLSTPKEEYNITMGVVNQVKVTPRVPLPAPREQPCKKSRFLWEMGGGWWAEMQKDNFLHEQGLSQNNFTRKSA